MRRCGSWVSSFFAAQEEPRSQARGVVANARSGRWWRHGLWLPSLIAARAEPLGRACCSKHFYFIFLITISNSNNNLLILQKIK